MAKRQLTDEEARYGGLVTLLEGLYDFHPDYFDTLSYEERGVLERYYFAGREIDVDDIYGYRSRVLKEDPELQQRAETILRRFFKQHNIDDDRLVPGPK